jgi:hypothetical protein
MTSVTLHPLQPTILYEPLAVNPSCDSIRQTDAFTGRPCGAMAILSTIRHFPCIMPTERPTCKMQGTLTSDGLTWRQQA